MKQLKKLLCVLLCLAFCSALMPAALAEDADVGAIKLVEEPEPAEMPVEDPAPNIPDGGAIAPATEPEALPTPGDEIEETYSGTCGDNLRWSLDSGVLTISGSGDMWNWSWDWYNRELGDAPWYNYRGFITSVKLPDGLTGIGSAAFSQCGNLTGITIPEGVTSIGAGAFQHCGGLTSVTIPKGVTSIGDSAFSCCITLTSVTLPRSLTNIGEAAFYNCSSLTSIALPERMTSIGASAFSSCSSLTSITIPKGVTSVGDRTFYECSSLTNITIPKGVTSIGYGAFYECSSLTNVTIPKGVTSVGERVFYGCSSLTSVTIPAGVTDIWSGTFYGCSSLTSITLPEGLTSIGGYAFQGCSSLASVSIPESVTVVGDWAFQNCSSLASVNLPKGLTLIGGEAFSGCSRLTNIVFHGSAPTIQSDSFDGVTATAYYPKNDKSWTREVRQNYGGKLTWVPYDPQHFSDVGEGKYFYLPVLWAYYHDPQITGGISETEFGPGLTCTREQIVTFLWKAMGAPEPKTTTNPFVDVPEGKWYYKPVLWAVEKGITGGMDATHFGVGKPCTREQAMTFLWKAMGAPDPTTDDNPFLDVPASKYYYKAVLWAVENGITSGVDAKHFGVGKSCTRGQIVTFLYKSMAPW